MHFWLYKLEYYIVLKRAILRMTAFHSHWSESCFCKFIFRSTIISSLTQKINWILFCAISPSRLKICLFKTETELIQPRFSVLSQLAVMQKLFLNGNSSREQELVESKGHLEKSHLDCGRGILPQTSNSPNNIPSLILNKR